MVTVRKVVAVTVPLLAFIAFRWPWDCINLEQEWQFAPFGLGLNQYVFYSILMQLIPLESVQQLGCEKLTPPSHIPEAQMYMGLYLKGIDAAAKALQRYPDSKELQRACIRQGALSSLFNPFTSAVAGSVGMVELFLSAFMKYKSDARFQELGFLGCLFDYSPENVMRFRYSNGVQLVHEIVKAHYNDSFVQFQCFCAYSSGCQHDNSEVCGNEEGLIETMVQVMRDHRKERVREEVMQVVKGIAMTPRHRDRLAEAGMVPQLVQVMQERTDSKTDQSVACEAFAALVDPFWPEFDKSNAGESSEMQTLLAKEGALDVAVKALDLAAGLSLHHGFGGQNAAALEQYNIERSCFHAMATLARRHPANQEELVRLGAPARIAAAMRGRPEDESMQVAACRAVSALSEDNAANKLAMDAAKPPSCAGRLPVG